MCDLGCVVCPSGSVTYVTGEVVYEVPPLKSHISYPTSRLGHLRSVEAETIVMGYRPLENSVSFADHSNDSGQGEFNVGLVHDLSEVKDRLGEDDVVGLSEIPCCQEPRQC